MKYVPIQNFEEREVKISSNGYVLRAVPEHPKAFRGWYYEHRLWYERFLGRVLKRWETVHHLNNNKQQNDWWNLFVCTRAEHDRAC